MSAPRICELEDCNQPIADKRSDARFHSDACRAADRRARNSAAGRIRSAIAAIERLAEIATKEDWAEFEDQFTELADRIATGNHESEEQSQ